MVEKKNGARTVLELRINVPRSKKYARVFQREHQKNQIQLHESRICWEFRIEEEADQNMVQKNPNRYEWRMPLELIFLGQESEASVNQQPVIPELEPPLLDDNSRREELAARLRANWWGVAYNERILDSFVQSQLSIERHVEAALVADDYSPQVVFERRHTIRGFLFYPEGHALQGGTYAGYLSQIANFDRKTKANEAEPRVIGWFSPGLVGNLIRQAKCLS
ncbi:hypothetical protein RYX36_028949 [Vicia faba]